MRPFHLRELPLPAVGGFVGGLLRLCYLPSGPLLILNLKASLPFGQLTYQCDGSTCVSTNVQCRVIETTASHQICLLAC